MTDDVVGKPHYEEYICKHCGRIVSVYEQINLGNTHAEMRPDACYDCSFWLNMVENPMDDMQVINGQLFSFPPMVEKEHERRRIITTDGRIICSDQFYNYGRVPAHFRHLFPDTAHFINLALSQKLKLFGQYRCKRIGCWDRMHCIWFTEENKTWNKIPANHKIGDEGCPLFVNKLNPYDK